MNEEHLHKALKELKVDFDPYFHTRVLGRLESANTWFSLSWKSLLPSLSLAVFCLLWIVVQEGSINPEAWLGLSELNTSLSDFLMYY